MIGRNEARSAELLPLRIRLHGVGTIDEETKRRDYQQGWQIHLSRKEICPKNRSHPCPTPEMTFCATIASTLASSTSTPLTVKLWMLVSLTVT